VGVEVETSVLEFAKLMLELYPSGRSKIRFVTQEEIYGKGYEDIPRRVPDNTKMRELLGVEPRVSLREGTAMAMEWFRHEANA
jgi:UDP-glucose 4-epimerase